MTTIKRVYCILALLQRVIAIFISLSTIWWMFQYKSQDITRLQYPNYVVVNSLYAIGVFLLFLVITVFFLILNLRNNKTTQKHFDKKLYDFAIKQPHLLAFCWIFAFVPMELATDYFGLLRGSNLYGFFWDPAPFVILSSVFCSIMTGFAARKLK